MPEWRLEHLYPAMNSPAFAADMKRAAEEANAFAESYRGKLATLAAAPDGPQALFDAVKRYEALEDLMGRIMSYAGLVYAGDTSDAAKGKFYGDAQEKITEASSVLLFFALELNRIDDALITDVCAKAPLSHFAPWIEDIRKEKPYQLEDRLEQLFHEKSVVGPAAWNRLFDDTISALRFDVDGDKLAIEPTLNFLQDADETKRRKGAEALAVTFKENIRLFALITNVLAKDKDISDRWRGFKDIADSRHLSNRVEPEVVEALVSAVRDAYPRLSHRYYKLKAKWFGKEQLNHWDRNAPLPKVDQRTIPWGEAKEMVLSAYAGFAPEMAGIAGRFFDEGWIDAPVRPGKSPGAFA
ncbi:MAG: M3 family oligoendopeptidase, partial [Beijerinckiaceae bacterium]